jgi:hypothetical protein
MLKDHPQTGKCYWLVYVFDLCLTAIVKECNNEILLLYSHNKDQTVPKLHGNMSQKLLKKMTAWLHKPYFMEHTILSDIACLFRIVNH